MANLRIEGKGIRILITVLDDEVAQKYAESGEITQAEHDELNNELESVYFGFYPDAIVSLDNQEIGTIESLIEQSKHLPKYQILHDALAEKADATLMNGLVNEQIQRGCFININFTDYPCEEDGSLSKEFVSELIKNLYIEDGNVFNLLGWEENDIEIDIDSLEKEDNYSLYYDEKPFPYKIISNV